ncbi:MAG: hypothetical protein DI628_02725 [Blastochloris viridis]|uniref:Secreted protein n=1 Tax=Blastochloris viridis TaxID=1079 RepID=A0A6N4R3N8_BLAVI|nr:MAG: hypothetical protein DI628_02725 [Blastochloris viridis]
MKFPLFLCTLALSLTVLFMPSAQERTAGGSLGNEASWSALRNMIDKTNGDVNVVRVDLNAMKNCAAQGKIWKPGAGCVLAAADPSVLNNVTYCGSHGMVFNGSGCVQPSTPAPNCRIEMFSTLNPSGGYMVLQPQNQGYKCVYSSRWQGSGGQYDSPTDNYSSICAKIVCN